MSQLGRYLAGLKAVGLVAGGILWLVWLISIALGNGNLDRNGQLIGADHAAFHAAAQLLREGRGAELFDYPLVPTLASRQQEIAGKEGFFNPFRNPPMYAALYVPTAPLPYLISYSIWALISILSLVGGLALVCGRKLLVPLLWSLTFYPVFATISFGQNSLLSVGIFGLVYYCVTRERLFFAGLTAGLLLFKPQLLLGLGLWWLLDFRHYWPSLAGIFCGSLVFAGVSWLVMPDLMSVYIRNLPEIARYDAFEFYNLHNPRGFGALITSDKRVGNWFGIAGLILALIWLFQIWRKHAKDRSIMFAAAIFATLFGSPHTMVYEWSLVVLSACLLWRARIDVQSDWRALFALVWVALFVSTPLTKFQLNLTGYAVQISVPVLAVVAWQVERRLSKPTTTNV